MLTSYTSSEEENIPYLRKFARNIRNNDKGPKLFEDTAGLMRVDRFASCENIVPSFKTSSILSPLPTPRTGLYIPLKKLFYSQCWRVLFQFLLIIMKGREMN